jgi:SprT protein
VKRDARPRYRPDRIEARVAALMAAAGAAGWPLHAWEVDHDLRGRAAGQAWPQTGRLRFNPVLGAENWDDFLHQTVAHEVAHLLACWRDGAAALGHGPAWREAMALFGCTPRRCHGYDTRNSEAWRQRRWPYRCGCPEPYLLTTTRHNRVQRQRWVYRCRSCGAALAYAG